MQEIRELPHARSRTIWRVHVRPPGCTLPCSVAHHYHLFLKKVLVQGEVGPPQPVCNERICLRLRYVRGLRGHSRGAGWRSLDLCSSGICIEKIVIILSICARRTCIATTLSGVSIWCRGSRGIWCRGIWCRGSCSRCWRRRHFTGCMGFAQPARKLRLGPFSRETALNT